MEIVEYRDSLFESIAERVSRRTFARKPSDAQLKELAVYAKALTAAGSEYVRVEVFFEGVEEVFDGLTNSYGMITGARAFAAFIAKTPGKDAEPPERGKVYTGFYGEQFILHATSMGVDTCWIAGSFDKNNAKRVASVQENERLLCVTPMGIAEEKYSFKEKLIKGFASSRKRKPLKDIVSNFHEFEHSPLWMKDAVEAARIAPSAMNSQPWEFTLRPSDESISAQAQGKSYLALLDLGIALSHIELAARHHGIKGSWVHHGREWIYRR